MIKIEFTQEQEDKLKDWKEAIKKVFGEYGHYDYIVSPTGIGDSFRVYSHLSKTYLDLTEYEKW